MKIRHSSLIICIAASLYAPQAFPEVSRTTPESEIHIDPVDDISSIYSDIDMRMSLATKPNGQVCSGDVCTSNQLFDAQVKMLGQRLTQSAYLIYPELKKSTPNFEFSVADKKVLGSASNASGKVVIFRDVQNLDLGDEALSFLIAREMGHVIAHHHKSNAKTKLLISVLAGILFPAVGILSASSAATQATTATSMVTSAASTATSFVGSEVALSRVKPSQLDEADDIAISLLEHEGLKKVEIAQALEFIVESEKSTGWEKDLYQSIKYVRKLAGEPKVTITKLEPLSEQDLVAETHLDESVTQKSNSEKPIENLAPVSQIEQTQPVQKPVEQHKVILITNESLAEDRIKASKMRKAKPAKTQLKKKVVTKKTTTKTVKAKKLDTKGIKSSTTKKASKKIDKTKAKVPVDAELQKPKN